jgi:hypothetical protein
MWSLFLCVFVLILFRRFLFRFADFVHIYFNFQISEKISRYSLLKTAQVKGRQRADKNSFVPLRVPDSFSYSNYSIINPVLLWKKTKNDKSATGVESLEYGGGGGVRGEGEENYLSSLLRKLS